MKLTRWPLIRASVRKWPRLSGVRLMLRTSDGACVASSRATIVFGGFGAAAAAVIRSASCAMKLPSPIMTAAKIIRLRMTPLLATGRPHNMITAAARTRRPNPAIFAKRMSERLMRLAIWAGPRQRPLNFQAVFATGLGITTRSA